MDEKIYGEDDCIQIGCDVPIAEKVIIIRKASLQEEMRYGTNQLYYCTGGSENTGRSVPAVSLADGEHTRLNRSDILGLFKLELLPDRARLQLSQIRPMDSEVPKVPEFFGYCFLPDGRYASGVPLSDAEGVKAYVGIQRWYQHRVMICDREDNCVLEMIGGEVIFPSQKDIERFNQEQTPPDAPGSGGMEMKP